MNKHNLVAPAIIFEQVCLYYSGTSAFPTQQILLKDLSLTLPGNQFNCILGPSGIGKSSLLRLIANLIPRDDKNIHYSGSIYATDGIALTHRIAYMAQMDLLLPWLNVLDNVLLSKKLHAKLNNDDLQQAHLLLEKVGLKNSAYQYPAQLSGGMRQRVALARTLFANKPIVLMDEPFSALDVITRLRLQELAAELLSQHTVVLVTHDPQEALRIGHRIHIMMGNPAHLSHWYEPKHPIPRAINNAEIMPIERELFTQLTRAQALTA